MGIVRDETERSVFFFFNDTATTEIYTLSLHDALPIYYYRKWYRPANQALVIVGDVNVDNVEAAIRKMFSSLRNPDRKSTRLNSSHANISYAVFCLKKQNPRLFLFICHLLLHLFPLTYS